MIKCRTIEIVSQDIVDVVTSQQGGQLVVNFKGGGLSLLVNFSLDG